MNLIPRKSALIAASISVLAWFGTGTASLAEGENLMTNASFETGDGLAGWTVFFLEQTDGDWLKIVDAPENGERAVEMVSGPPERYIWQDVSVEGGGDYVLRWKARGAGRGSVGVRPRAADDTMLQEYSRIFDAGGDFEIYEMDLSLPPETMAIRIIVAAVPSESTISFDQFELLRK